MATKRDLDWSFGLINTGGKYLTLESFGNRINCAASIMKKKQIFFLENGDGQGTSEDGAPVHIRSHKGTYIRVDGDGNFLCDAEAQSEETEICIEAQDDGRWALRSNKYGWYLGAKSEEDLKAFTTDISEDKLWTIHLAMHPMVTLNNLKRKAYVHLSDDGSSLTTDEIIPWGADAVLELEFFDSDGTYGIKGSNGKYLASTGMLKDSADEDTHFVIEFHGGLVTFKSKVTSKYLTSLGAGGLCKATKAKITDDEKFRMENSYPQISLVSKNGKYVSTKQGIELAATATAVSDLETFQFEPQGGSAWKIRSAKYFIGGSDAGVKEDAHEEASEDEKTFNVEWHGNQIAIQASNGQYFNQAMNSYLKLSGEVAEDSLFTFAIVNRPQLALRGAYGFVNTMGSGLLRASFSSAEDYHVEYKDGLVALSSSNGKFWKVGEDGISATSETPEFFKIELYQNSKCALVTESGKYMSAAQNGDFKANGTGPTAACLFEY